MPVGVRYSNDSFSIGQCRELDEVPMGGRLIKFAKFRRHVEGGFHAISHSISAWRRSAERSMISAESNLSRGGHKIGHSFF
jgi:hypothetical protein